MRAALEWSHCSLRPLAVFTGLISGVCTFFLIAFELPNHNLVWPYVLPPRRPYLADDEADH